LIKNKKQREENKMKSKKPVIFIIVFIALLMTYTGLNGITAGNFKILGAPDMRFGIDIRGGVDAAFEPDGLDRKPTSEELEAARSIIETRLDQKNILDRDVSIDKDNGYILVRFPWKADEKDFDPETAMAELGETAELTFKDKDGNVLLQGSHVKKAEPVLNQQTNEFEVSLKFDKKGTKLFADATEKYLDDIIYIYMDETLISYPKVSAHITSGDAVINGMKDIEEARDLANKINSGALPFSMITKNHQTISPSLGAGALNVMVNAGIIAFCIICALLIIYYRLPGIVACISLLIQVSGQLLALSIPQITLTLTGIAGVILSIGMGVDANVIVSERISEEIKSGKSLRSAIKSGFKGAFSSVFDGNITVLIVAVILMAKGSGSLLSFAYTLLTGIVFNFIAGVTASRLMILSLSNYRVFQNLKLYTCLSRRVTMTNNRVIGFFKKRWVFFIASLSIMAIGIAGMFIRGVNLDIQFKGGALLKYNFTGEINEDTAAEVVSKMLDNRPVTPQITTDFSTNDKRLVLNIAGNYGLEANVQQKLEETLIKEFPNANLKLSESSMVEPFFGKKFLRDGIIAVILAFICVMFYVWIRFNKIGGLSAGLMALIALFHDVLIVFFTFVLFNIPIGDSFIAVALTIIGYSINDTIVIYDRIRENSNHNLKLSVDQITDLSISQSMSRSVNTSVAVLISIGMIFILAVVNSIESVQSFALPMAIGSISGCYSTICIAGPLWVMWKKHKSNK
jgi:SecD/SecF fusion protein